MISLSLNILISFYSLFSLSPVIIDNNFIFDENKLEIGTLYTYEISKSQEYKPHEILIYVKALDTVVVLSTGKKYSYLETYVFDWQHMMLKAGSKKILGSDKEQLAKTLPLYALYEYSSKTDFDQNVVRITQQNNGEEGIFKTNKLEKFDSIPTLFYSDTDALDQWYLMRFFPLETSEQITVNVLHDDRNVEAIIEYEGTEIINTGGKDYKCYKFEIYPNSIFWRFFAKDTFIWLSSDNGNKMTMIKYINENPLNAFQPRLEYNFIDSKIIDPEEWLAIINQYSK